MRKKLAIAAGLGAALLVAVLLGAALMIDSLVRAGTETGASFALKVPAKLRAATIKYSGRATLVDFEIGNPEGYKEPRAATFETFDARLRVSSLFGDVIEVHEVLVQKPELTIEFAGLKSNWSVLLDNLSGPSSETPDSPSPSKPSSGKKLKIARLRVEGAAVRFHSDLIPGGSIRLPLPPLELRDIGTASSGVPLSAVLERLLRELAGESMKAGEGSLPEQLLGPFRLDLGGAKRNLNQAIDSVGEKLKATRKDLEKGVEELFKKK